MMSLIIQERRRRLGLGGFRIGLVEGSLFVIYFHCESSLLRKAEFSFQLVNLLSTQNLRHPKLSTGLLHVLAPVLFHLLLHQIQCLVGGSRQMLLLLLLATNRLRRTGSTCGASRKLPSWL